MTATDPADGAALPCEHAPGHSTHETVASPAAAQDGAQMGAQVGGQPDEQEDEQALLRILDVPRDVGWLMVSVGVVGVILPGLPGTPFLLAGVAVLAPGGPRLLTRWVGRKPKGMVHAGLTLIGRWLDDLERRYPRSPPTGAAVVRGTYSPPGSSGAAVVGSPTQRHGLARRGTPPR